MSPYKTRNSLAVVVKILTIGLISLAAIFAYVVFSAIRDDSRKSHPLRHREIHGEGAVINFDFPLRLYPGDIAFTSAMKDLPNYSKLLDTMHHDSHFRMSFVIEARVCLAGSHFTQQWEPTSDNIVLCPRWFNSRDFLPGRTTLHDQQAMLFSMMHELGHAYFHKTGHNQLGREEDAADAFATFLALDAGEPEVAIAGADGLESIGTGGRNDAHEPPEQRGYRIRCIVALRTGHLVKAGLSKADFGPCRTMAYFAVIAWENLVASSATKENHSRSRPKITH